MGTPAEIPSAYFWLLGARQLVRPAAVMCRAQDASRGCTFFCTRFDIFFVFRLLLGLFGFAVFWKQPFSRDACASVRNTAVLFEKEKHNMCFCEKHNFASARSTTVLSEKEKHICTSPEKSTTHASSEKREKTQPVLSKK